MVVGSGLLFWILCAKIARMEAAKEKADYDALRAYADWLNAYRNGLRDALDDATREQAVEASREVQDKWDAWQSKQLNASAKRAELLDG
jgi:hypothetical protein